jgi:hypothetical protein
MLATSKLSLIIGAVLLALALPILAEGVSADRLKVREGQPLGRETSLTVYDAWGVTEFSSTSGSERNQIDAYLRAVNASHEAAATLRLQAQSPDRQDTGVFLNTSRGH